VVLAQAGETLGEAGASLHFHDALPTAPAAQELLDFVAELYLVERDAAAKHAASGSSGCSETLGDDESGPPWWCTCGKKQARVTADFGD
jgi:hypothetical protein